MNEPTIYRQYGRTLAWVTVYTAAGILGLTLAFVSTYVAVRLGFLPWP